MNIFERLKQKRTVFIEISDYSKFMWKDSIYDGEMCGRERKKYVAGYVFACFKRSLLTEVYIRGIPSGNR